MSNRKKPDARVIAAKPAHWHVAISVLVRAVLLDGVPVDDPAVRALLDVLAPIAEAELSYGQAASLAAYGIGSGRMADEPGFPEQDGPMFLLGTCALIDATGAVIGLDPLHDVLGVLTPLLDNALPELGGQVVAEALVRAYSHHYRCELPGDEQVLERLATPGPGNPLEDLVVAKVVTAGDSPRVGLTALAALGDCARASRRRYSGWPPDESPRDSLSGRADGRYCRPTASTAVAGTGSVSLRFGYVLSSSSGPGPYR